MTITPSPEKPVVHIVGLGSMGSILAMDLLEFTDAEVVPLFRNEQKLKSFQIGHGSKLSTKRVYLSDSPVETKQIQRSYCPSNYSGEHIKNLVVTTKTYQTTDALRPFLPYIDSETNLILIQNGLGVLESLSEGLFSDGVLSRPNLFQGVIAHGAFQESDFMFNYTCLADMKIARISWNGAEGLVQPSKIVVEDALNNELIRLLTQPAFSKEFVVKHMTYQEMLIGQLYKFLVNSCINSISAIVDCRNGEIIDNAKPVFSLIVKESLTILKLAYAPLFQYEQNYNGKEAFPFLKVDETFEFEPLVDTIFYLTCVLGEQSSTSMREDTKHFRDTEIDYINGYVVSLAEKLGLGSDAVNVNRLVVELVNLRAGLNKRRANQIPV
ncbi:uncharacterized protein KNAG_0B04630 [Huiozyma naganishii CBS 8797]|uniref:2-dehydropantoate 2-reductase n=1 Tax=Huiozyma naganishii (strain ATCC MYA-139 / BCRC 22969 / CBS 8797 / KCTC 17520 / NBRC 10181 / NCYC 3082 / Yp74L-3) TaxID=1071383 RepID=J7RH84_HUIN7|nr:hypothetical protein KNAG_0B04630 [Kazachstania naganishii CBS 8797]CCK68898.1 hypothetical protein KNAG_0B04630 [Kazachstania naganishii CBS 8797]